MNEVIAVIPARLGSKRVPDKNIRKFKDMTLIDFSIKAAKLCDDIHRIIVSTNDPRVEKIAKIQNVEVHWRPDHLATDTAGTFETLQHLYFSLEKNNEKLPEFFVLLQPTSPLREKNLIYSALKSIRSDTTTTSLITVCEHKIFTGKIIDKYWVGDYPEDTRSQDINPIYYPSGSLFVYRCKETIKKNDALGKYTIPVIENPDKCVNIDYESDFIRL
ncbi:Acylneuraminate cytidylyltransferase, partial [Candidatus Magnetomorum sp. HK-1]